MNLLIRLIQLAIQLAGPGSDKAAIVLAVLMAVLPNTDPTKLEYVAARVGDLLSAEDPGEQLWLEVNGVFSELADDLKEGGINL